MNIVQAKKDLINIWKRPAFHGSFFEGNLEINGQPICIRYFKSTGEEIFDSDFLLTRLKIKIILKPISKIYQRQNYISLFDRQYYAVFYKQNTYAEFEEVLSKEEVFQFVLFSKADSLRA
jgi:hypothetical protein